MHAHDSVLYYLSHIKPYLWVGLNTLLLKIILLLSLLEKKKMESTFISDMENSTIHNEYWVKHLSMKRFSCCCCLCVLKFFCHDELSNIPPFLFFFFFFFLVFVYVYAFLLVNCYWTNRGFGLKLKALQYSRAYQSVSYAVSTT